MTWLLAFRQLPWRLIGLSALALAFLGLIAALKIERSQNEKLKAQITACSQARAADRTTYEQAQKQAAEANKAEVARKEAEQKAINNEAISNLNARLERLRSELRSNATAQSPSSGTSAPQAGSGPAAPGEARVCYAPEDVLRAAENEERHDQLITVVERLMKAER